MTEKEWALALLDRVGVVLKAAQSDIRENSQRPFPHVALEYVTKMERHANELLALVCAAKAAQR